MNEMHKHEPGNWKGLIVPQSQNISSIQIFLNTFLILACNHTFLCVCVCVCAKLFPNGGQRLRFCLNEAGGLQVQPELSFPAPPGVKKPISFHTCYD